MNQIQKNSLAPTRISKFRAKNALNLKFSPVLDYSGEQNIPMTTNPNGFSRHFHVICSYGLTPYRKSAPPIKGGDAPSLFCSFQNFSHPIDYVTICNDFFENSKVFQKCAVIHSNKKGKL